MKLSIIAEGGGMRGAYALGVLDALENKEIINLIHFLRSNYYNQYFT